MQTQKEKLDIPIVVLIGYILSFAFEGPIRVLLSIGGIETLLYSRDLFALIVILWAALKNRSRSPQSLNITAIFVYILICHSVISLWLGHTLGSTLFAIKIFLGLALGLACSNYLHTHQKLLTKLIVLLFLACCIGVFINATVGMLPWEGAEFESAFGSATNRLWWAGGERRLPGFARSSTTTAAAIGLSGLFLMSYVKNYFIKFLILCIGIPAVYLTTSKGVILSFLITGCWCFIPSGKIKRPTGLSLLWGSALLAAILPFASAYIEPNPSLIRMAPGFLSSFADRASNTWPDALRDLDTWYLWLIGQGVGGIGSPLRYSNEIHRFNPIDNLFLYSFTIFGLLGAFYYAFAANRISKIDLERSNYNLGLFTMGIHFFCYGITAHQLEEPLESTFFGMLIAYTPYLWKSYQARSTKKT